MPATRRTVSRDARQTPPYTLNGATKAQLATLTVASLKSHLKHFKLPVAGVKTALVDRLHSHLAGNQEMVTDNPQPAANTEAYGAAATGSQQVSTQNPQSQQIDGANGLPQNIIDQLRTIVQEAQTSRGTGTTDMNPDPTDDDRLSAASVPVQRTNTTLSQSGHTSSLTNAVETPVPPVPQPTLPQRQPILPPAPVKIQEKIQKGEYIDFSTLSPKSMFGAPEPQSQTVTIQLNSSGDNFSIQPQATGKKITSFSAWMEAWNVYMAYRISFNPSCAPYLVAYQRIITSASIKHPLHAWLSYDIKFRTKAASDPSLQWDVRDIDLWLEHFPGTGAQPNRWPCSHCGSTAHYPSNCPFRSSPANAQGGGAPTPYGGGQSAPAVTQQRPTSTPPNTCRDYNRNSCYRTNCRFLHRCEHCGGTHQGKSCLFKGQPRPN